MEINPLEVHAGGNNQYTTKREKTNAENWVEWGETSDSEIFDRYDAMMESFAQMVRGEKQNPYTPDYELELYKTVLKACGK